ncbi:MAG: hypothetical protein IKB07_08160 [Lachnospiraceae bacterium]|nr:hypothetical protein [Lachnospiraceae bacterium]
MGKFLDYINSQDKAKKTGTGKFGSHVAEQNIGLDTLQSDLTSASKLVNRVYRGWHSADDMKKSYQTVSSMRDRLTAYKGYTNSNNNGKDLTEFNRNMDKLIKSYDDALTGWGSLSAEYGKYSDSFSYNMAKKNADRLKKYKGLDFDGVQKAIKENPGDADFLSKYGLNVGYANKADAEKELRTVDYLIETTSGETQKAWKDYRNRLYDATMINRDALFKGSDAFADGYQPGDVLDALGATAVDAVVKGSKGLLGAMEGVADFATHGASRVADFFGAEKAAESMKEHANRNMTQDLYRPYYSSNIQNDSFLGGMGDAVMEGVGQMGFNLATGGIGKGLGLGKVGTQILTSGSLLASSAGSGMSEAYQNGATDGEAFLYGLMSGAFESGSELMFGGLGKGINALGLSRGIAGLDDMFAKKVGNKIGNFVLRNAAEYGIKAAGEGLEEVFAGLGSAVAKKFTYMSDEELGQLVEDEELLNAFLVGTLSSAFVQSPSLLQSYRYGTDYVTDRNAAEELYVETEYESRLAEAEKDGKKLSKREKDKLYSQVEKDLTAERQKAYESMKRNAPDAVGKMASMDVSDTVDNVTGNAIRLQGIRTDETGNTVLKTSMGERARDAVTLNRKDAELVEMAEGMEPSHADLFVSMYNGQDVTAYKDSFDMAYAYGKNAFGVDNAVKRRGVLSEAQAIQAYKLGISERTANPQKKADAVTEKYFSEGGTINAGTFSDKGVNYKNLNSRQKASASFAKMFSKATGVNVVLFESKADKNGVRTAENGRYDKKTNTVYVDVYAGFKENEGVFEDSMIPTMSHEVTHWMKEKAPEAYAKLSEVVMDTLSVHYKSTPEALVAAEKNNHKKRGRDVSDEYAQDEIIARACEDMLSGNKTANEIIEKMDVQTLKTFSEKFKEVIDKIRAWLKELLGVYQSNSEEAKAVRKYDAKMAELQKAWDEAFAKAVRANQAMQNSETEDVAASERTQNSDRITKKIMQDFGRQYDAWDKKNPRLRFKVGVTGNALETLGVPKKGIFIDSSKLASILNDHPEMKDVVKKLPLLINDPILVMDSRSVSGRLVLTGELLVDYKIKNNPVMVALELHPVGRNGIELDEIRVASAYARNSGMQYLIENSVLRYINPDMQRTNSWLADTGLQLPFGSITIGSNGIVTYNDSIVKENVDNTGNRKKNEAENVQNSDRDSEGNGLTKEQIEFFKNSKALDKEGNLMVVYHGTVREFYTFDKQYANPEGNMGSGFYFTNDIGDVERNYANFDGPDFVIKLEHEAEMLVWPNSEEYVNEDGEYMDVDEIVEVLREKYATSEEPVTLKTYLNIQNPCYVGEHQTYLMSDISSEYDMEDFEDENEYDEAVEQMASDYIDDIMAAVDAEGFYNTDDIPSILYDAYAEGGITLEDLKTRLNDLYIEGENGELVANEVARIIVEKLGYDGIIDSTVSEKFKNMGIGKGTVHYIVFNSNQAKLTSNQTPTSNEDIRYSTRDSEGNGLTKEQIQFFKDSQVRDENGNLKVVYHGTHESFTVFRPNEYITEQNGGSNIAGYFSENESYAENYGITSAYYLDIKNPLRFEDTAMPLDKWKSWFKKNGVNGVVFDSSVTGKNGTRDTLKGANFDGVVYYSMVDLFDAGAYWTGDGNLTDKIKDAGYDGMVWEEEGLAWMPFNPNQIKSIDNKNPTSDADIHYSDRQTESIYDAVGALKRIQRENNKLKADIERLRKKNKLERTVTGGRELNESHIAAVAGHILKLADSSYNKADLASELKGIYEYLQGEDVEWDVFMSKATDLSQRVAAEARERKVKDDYAKMILSTIRNTRVSFNDTQKAEAEYAYGKNWIRNFFGRVTVANDGIPLESAWSEWAAMYPDVFDADISDADMVTALLDIYDSTKTASEVVETYDKSEVARELAFEIYNQFWNVSPVRTLADKHDKEVKRLKFEHRQEMKELRERKDAEVFETRWHYSELIHKVREARDEKIAQLKKESHEYTKQYREKLERRNQISQITKKSLKLNTWLKNNTKKEHIVEELKEPVAAVLRALDFSSESLLGTGEPTQKDISLKKAFAHLYKKMKDIDDGQGPEDYSLDMPIDYVNFLGEIKEQIDGIVEKVGDNQFVLRDMTLEQLQDVNKMLSILSHIVRSANKALADANGKAISNMAQSTMLYADSLGEKNKKVGGISNFFNFDNKLPVYAFKMMGEGGQQIFRNMQNGWDKMAFHVKQIIDYSEACYEAKEVNKWSKEVHEFKFADGSKAKMTTAHIMSLYCLQKREQARNHLIRGGIRVENFKNGANTITNEKGALLLPHEIDKVVSTLTERQKKVADDLQKFMNTVCSDWGNEVSMRRFGIKSFGEENYFPIQSDANVTPSKDSPNSRKGSEVFRLLNMDFTKELNPNASNRIMVDNIFDVFATHTSDMAKYNALALPVLDMFRWYSYKETYKFNPEDPEDKRRTAKTLRQSLESAYGDGATKYIFQFMKDINGAHSGGMLEAEKFGRKMISYYKTAAVGANLRVAFLQPVSYVRASAVMDPKYLSAALLHKPQIQKAKDTCGIALWKSLGFYDTNINRGVTSMIKHDESAFDWIKDKSMKLAEWGDSMTWGFLYNACEAEIKDTQPGLTGEAKDRAVAERLRDVIYATQVVDSTMTRTQMMRSKSGIAQMYVSFMSEPMMSYNLLMDGYTQFNADKRKTKSAAAALRKNKNLILRSVFTYCITSLTGAAIGGLFDTWRDDEEEEFTDAYIENVTENMISDVLGMVPVLKDFFSLGQGYSPTRMDEAFMTSTWNALKKIWKAKDEGINYKAVYSMLKTVSQLTGLPMGSFVRDVVMIWNNTVGEVYESLKLK